MAFRKLHLLFLFLIFSGTYCFSQQEACIRNEKKGKIVYLRQWDEIFFLERSDSLDSDKQKKIKTEKAPLTIKQINYRRGTITKVLDSSLIIEENLANEKFIHDTISFHDFFRIAKYRSGTGQKIVGGIFIAGGIAPFIMGIQAGRDNGLPLIGEGVILGLPSIAIGLFIVSIHPNKAIQLNKDWVIKLH